VILHFPSFFLLLRFFNPFLYFPSQFLPEGNGEKRWEGCRSEMKKGKQTQRKGGRREGEENK
jgi:hypothetical protein